MKIKDWILQVRHRMGDLDKDFYECDEQLIHYFNEALCLIYKAIPARFANVYNFELQSGDLQKLGEHCKFLSADAMTNDQGAFLHDLRLINERLSARWNGRCCSNGQGIRAYFPDQYVKNAFYIKPPVPTNGTHWARVKATCNPNPLPLDNDDFEIEYGCDVEDMATQWALHSAFSNATSPNDSLSTKHLSIFKEMLGIHSAVAQNIGEYPKKGQNDV